MNWEYYNVKPGFEFQFDYNQEYYADLFDVDEDFISDNSYDAKFEKFNDEIEEDLIIALLRSGPDFFKIKILTGGAHKVVVREVERHGILSDPIEEVSIDYLIDNMDESGIWPLDGFEQFLEEYIPDIKNSGTKTFQSWMQDQF